jgi:hypothetical protein
VVREADNEAGSGLIAWISAGLNVTNVFMRAAGTLARKVPTTIVRAGGHLGNAATVGAVAYEVYREEGLTHKVERAGAGVAAAGANIALADAAASTAETAALTGVAGAAGATAITAAAPIVLAGVAAGVTAKAADLAIETRRTYEDLVRSIAEQAAPQKIRKRAEGEKPSFIDYKHLAGMREVAAGMRDEALRTTAPIERFAGSGVIKNIKAIDMTDRQNLREYERALNAEIERQTAIKSANDSYMPRWLRGGESVDKYNDANGVLQNLLGAKEELAMFQRDLQQWQEAMRAPASGGHLKEETDTSVDIAKAAGHETMPSGKRQEIATGFNAAGTASEKPAHQTSGDVAAARPRAGRGLTPG